MNSNYSFNTFVMSVLRQKASTQNQEIFFDSKIPTDLLGAKANGKVLFDAVAPNGFENISGPVIFEFKFSQQIIKYDKLKSILNGFYKRVMQSTFSDVTLILIANAYIDLPIDIAKDVGKGIPGKGQINLKIWDRKVINQWIDQYPIDYSNAQNRDVLSQSKETSVRITEVDFSIKSENNLKVIKGVIEKKDNFAFVLGAGISIDPGAKSWDQLLDFFTVELKKQGIIDDDKKLNGKIGGSSIITAQLCKELYPNDQDYYWAIHQGLYRDRKPINPDFALYHVARIASACVDKAHFRILTYNYDNYLESYLENIGVPCNTLYDSKSDINDKLSIYHVHGYLPEVEYKTHMQDRCKKSIYLTEENYNELYNHPYSWQISSQLSFFRENICLFVGCSLADPNIRRLLEMTKKENRIHYAIMTTNEMTTKDLVKASNHFARIGIEVIWVNDYKEISKKLSFLY